MAFSLNIPKLNPFQLFTLLGALIVASPLPSKCDDSTESPPQVEIAVQYHIVDEPAFPREPWAAIWRSRDTTAFDKIHGGPMRLSLHTVPGDFFLSLVPVTEFGEIDGERLYDLQAAGGTVVKAFAIQNQVELNPLTKSITAIMPNGKRAPIGALLKDKAAHLCTGPFRNSCSLNLVKNQIAIENPIDWSSLHIILPTPPKVVACDLSTQPDILNFKSSLPAKLKLLLNVKVESDSNSSCETVKNELQWAFEYYSKLGIRLEFTGTSSQTTVVDFVGVMPPDTTIEPGANGYADVDNNKIFLIQPRFGERKLTVFAHEVGHILGLEHTSAPDNLMRGAGVDSSSTSLTPEQLQIIFNSSRLKPL